MLIISSGFYHHLRKGFYKFSACISADELGLRKGAGGAIVNFCMMCSDKNNHGGGDGVILYSFPRVEYIQGAK